MASETNPNQSSAQQFSRGAEQIPAMPDLFAKARSADLAQSRVGIRWRQVLASATLSALVTLPVGFALGLKSNFVIDSRKELVSTSWEEQKPDEIILTANCIKINPNDPGNPQNYVFLSVDDSKYIPTQGGVVLIAQDGIGNITNFHTSAMLQAKDRGLLPTNTVPAAKLRDFGGLTLSVFRETNDLSDVDDNTQFNPATDLLQRLAYLQIHPHFCD